MTEMLDGKYTLGKVLGKGQYSKVRIGTDSIGNKYAIKIMERSNTALDDRFLKLINAEVATLKKLAHPNIVNLKDFNENGTIVKSDSTQVSVLYMALELVSNGEMFDYLASTGRFSEPICLLFFKELCGVLDYVHKQDICHRDLKAENVMLDNEYKLKLLDFGFAACKYGRDGSGMLSTYLGTPTYMAPEIQLGKPYKGTAVDIFAAGVLLFIMFTGHPPFRSAKIDDSLYKFIANGKPEMFWMFHSKNKPNTTKFFSENLKALLTGMLEYEPSKRLTLDMIISHPWIKGACATQEQRLLEFATRQNVLKEQAKRQEQIMVAQHQPGIVVGQGEYRADFEKEMSECIAMPLKMFYKYQIDVVNPCAFYSKLNANYIIRRLKYCIGNLMKVIKIEEHGKKYKLVAEVAGECSNFTLSVKISKVSDGVSYVEIVKTRGDKSDFIKMYGKLFDEKNADSAIILKNMC